MAATIAWQRDCPGYIETELVNGVIQVTCWVEEGPGPNTRVTDGLQVLYTFLEGTGTTVRDVSEVGTPLDLAMESEAAVSWKSGGGLSVNSATMLASVGAATKVIQAAKASNEITLEGWVKPADLTQTGPARILTLSVDYHHRNFQLAQAEALYDVRLRTTTTTVNGRPSVFTAAGTLTATLTHVAYTRAASGVARIYLNGSVSVEQTVGGDLSNWDDGYRLALANEVIGSFPWLGEYYLIAIYGRALSAEEVQRNLAAGKPSS
jgi:Concanavalin A-like lectin/glucanases superfamily